MLLALQLTGRNVSPSEVYPKPENKKSNLNTLSTILSAYSDRNLFSVNISVGIWLP